MEARATELEEAGIDFKDLERYILLRTTDNLWMDHIDALTDLRQGVGLQAIGQHDPLVVYKKEAYDMFEKLNEQIEVQTIRMLFFGKIVRGAFSKQNEDEGEINPEKSLNGPCPCGSGKKYKNCCYLKEKAASKQTEEAADRPLTKQEEYALKRQQRKEQKNKK